MSTARIETEDGTVEVDDFVDNASTLPIVMSGSVEPGPALVRVLADLQYQTCERIAQALESSGVLMRPADAAAKARSMAWALP